MALRVELVRLDEAFGWAELLRLASVRQRILRLSNDESAQRLEEKRSSMITRTLHFIGLLAR